MKKQIVVMFIKKNQIINEDILWFARVWFALRKAAGRLTCFSPFGRAC
jgi:hypothetical protein